MALSWPRAFKKSVAYIVWLIVWSFVGIALIGAGVYVGSASLVNLISALMSGIPPTVDSSLLAGLALAAVGYVVMILGAIASLVRLLYDVAHQATLDISAGALEIIEQQQRATVATPSAQRAVAPPTRVGEPAMEPAVAPQPPVTVETAPPVPVRPQVKYCAFCGKAIPMSARFCQYCQRAQP